MKVRRVEGTQIARIGSDRMSLKSYFVSVRLIATHKQAYVHASMKRSACITVIMHIRDAAEQKYKTAGAAHAYIHSCTAAATIWNSKSLEYSLQLLVCNRMHEQNFKKMHMRVHI